VFEALPEEVLLAPECVVERSLANPYRPKEFAKRRSEVPFLPEQLSGAINCAVVIEFDSGGHRFHYKYRFVSLAKNKSVTFHDRFTSIVASATNVRIAEKFSVSVNAISKLKGQL